MKRMKNTMMLLILMVASTVTYAQSTGNKKSSYPYWTISKDVQRLQFRNVEYLPAAVKTGDVASVSSKGITRFNIRKSHPAARTVVMTGMPASVISKGVARMQYERKANR